MKIKTLLLSVLAASLLTAGTGCASIFGGKYNTLIVEQGTPPGAEVYLDNQKIGTAPFKKKIDKYVIQHGSIIEFRKEGYKTDSLTILRKPHPWYTVGDIFTLGIGLVIDASNGALFRPQPRKFEYNLEKK